MDIKIVVLACVGAVLHSRRGRALVLEKFQDPDLKDIVDRIVISKGRKQNGMIDLDYEKLVGFFNSRVQEIAEWVKPHERLFKACYERQIWDISEVTLRVRERIRNHPRRGPYKAPGTIVTGTGPSMKQKIATFSLALKKWTQSGFEKAPPEVMAQREALCRSCDHWVKGTLENSGKCRICGCFTWLKIRMLTEKCPINKW